MNTKIIDRQKNKIDLLVIVLISIAVLAIAISFDPQIMGIVEDTSINILLRTLLLAFFQFGLAGLGVTAVILFRKDSFKSYGLNKKNITMTITLSILCFVPSLIISFVTGDLTSYLPFQQVMTTQEVLASSFPVNVVGMLITATAWGFFEGFNYVIISDKINALYPNKNKLLNWGAITCSILCILIHGIIGVTPSAMINMFATMFIIYGMLLVRQKTGSAWGCIFIFVFMWNAFN